jgi:hypothetical protein
VDGFTDALDNPLDEAILRTLIYADLFQFPMTASEIHRFLIGYAATPDEVYARLTGSAGVAARLMCAEDYYAPRETAAISLPERLRHEAASQKLFPIAVHYGGVLAHIPFVRMVALTGALAMRNAKPDDDIDYLLVTTPRRVWLARALVVVIVRIARLRGIQLCPNYVLSETALEQTQHDLYIAHEVTQMIPLAGGAVYRALRTANAWTDDLLPNTRLDADAPIPSIDARRQPFGYAFQRIGEWLLGGRLGDAIEDWEKRRKVRKFAADAQKPHSSAQLDAEHVKGHFNDYGYPTLQRYAERLRQSALTAEPSPMSAGADK